VFACCLLAAAVWTGALTDAGQARGMRGLSRAAGARVATAGEERPPAVASLEKCVTASAQPERYAIFTGRMSAIPGSTAMAMRIGIEERTRGESFHPLEGADSTGLGSWRDAEPGVKIFKDLKQVSDLLAPVDYRAVVRFRWINTKGIVIKRATLRTPSCREPAPEGQVGETSSAARMPGR
jgi:hypothetical protein